MLVSRQLFRAGVRLCRTQKHFPLARTFAWWSSSKNSKEAVPQEPLDDDPKNMDNLHFLINAIKKENSLKSRTSE